MEPFLTVCVAGADDEAALAATVASAAEAGVPVLVGDLRGLGPAPGRVALDGAPSWPAALADLVAAASTDWVLLVHPGETVRLDRPSLASEVAGDAVALGVEHAVGLLPGCPQLPAERLVRRAAVRLHGRVAPQWDPVPVARSRGVHLGGVPARLEAEGPATQWLLRRAAAAERDDPSPRVRAEVAVLLAAAGHHDAAAARLAGLDVELTPAERRRYGRALVAATLAGGRPREARFGVLRWHGGCQATGAATAWLGQVEVAAGRPGSALRLYRDAAALPLVDDDGFGVDPTTLAVWQGVAEHLLDELDVRLAGALDEMEHTSDARLPVLVAQIATMWSATRREADRLVARLGERGRVALFTVLLVGSVHDTADWLDVFGAFVASEGLPERLALRLAEVAPMLSESEALEWSARVRAAGHRSACPLVARARSLALDPAVRVRAAAMALEVYGDDEEAAEALAGAAASVEEAQLGPTLLAVDELAPSALPVVVLGAATTPARMLVLADLLDRFGAPEQAELLRVAAHETVN